MKFSSSEKYHSLYTAKSEIRHPLQLFQLMGRDLLASRELAWRLFVRDIKAQYRQSILGILWAFFPPTITSIALGTSQKISPQSRWDNCNIPFSQF